MLKTTTATTAGSAATIGNRDFIHGTFRTLSHSFWDYAFYYWANKKQLDKHAYK